MKLFIMGIMLSLISTGIFGSDNQVVVDQVTSEQVKTAAVNADLILSNAVATSHVVNVEDDESGFYGETVFTAGDVNTTVFWTADWCCTRMCTDCIEDVHI